MIGERVLGAAARAATALAALSLGIMMLVTDYDIIARMAFHQPFHGVVNIVEMLMLCVAFLGLPEVCFREEQIRVDIIDELVPRRVLLSLKIFGSALTAIVMAILSINVFFAGFEAFRFGDIKPDISFPTYPLFGLAVCSFLISFMIVIAKLCQTIWVNVKELL